MDKSTIIAGTIAGLLIGAAILIDGAMNRQHEKEWLYDCYDRSQLMFGLSFDQEKLRDFCDKSFVERGGY